MLSFTNTILSLSLFLTIAPLGKVFKLPFFSYEQLCAYVPRYIRKSEDTLQEFTLHHVHPRDWTWVLKNWQQVPLPAEHWKVHRHSCGWLLGLARVSTFSIQSHSLGRCTVRPRWTNEPANGASRKLRISLKNTDMMWLRNCRHKDAGMDESH